MTETELKRFTISLIKSKEKENEDYIRYSYYELKVKDNLSEEEIDDVLRISRDYFENKGYKVYFTNAEFEYQNVKRKVKINEYMIAFKKRLDTAMENVVENINKKIKELKRELTEDEKNEIIEQCYKEK